MPVCDVLKAGEPVNRLVLFHQSSTPRVKGVGQVTTKGKAPIAQTSREESFDKILA